MSIDFLSHTCLIQKKFKMSILKIITSQSGAKIHRLMLGMMV